jgi:molecular chaperone GrpE
MHGQWGKVARWAGLGHNNHEDESDAKGSSEQMVEETTVPAVEEQEHSEPQGSHEAVPGAEPVHAEPEAQIDPNADLKIELEQMRGERDQLLDRLARLQAEFENARRREAKERADARDYSVANAVEAFLPVMDNFQLALGADGTVEQLRGGVELILKQMEEALRTLNVQVVETVGTQFDPRIHEALGSIETPEFPDNQVLEEIRRGYRIKEKLLRPAMVRIASNPAQVSE